MPRQGFTNLPRDGAARPRFPWFLTLLFALCVAILGGVMVSFVANLRSLSRWDAEVGRRIEVLRAVDSLQLRLLSAETGFRSFLLTGKAESLEPYYRARHDYKGDIQRIADLISSDPAQERSANALRELIEKRFEDMNAALQAREAQGSDATQAAPLPGDETMVRIGAVIGELRDREDVRFAVDAGLTNDTALFTLAFTLGTGVLGIAGLTAFYALTRRYFFQKWETERALRTREAEFRTMFDVAAVGIVECQAESGGIVRANSKFSAMLGYSVLELSQMNFFQLLHPSTAAADREAFKDLMTGRSAEWIVERRCISRDGAPLWVRASFGLIPEAEGVPPRAVGIIEDINARKQVERELRDNAAILRTVAEDTQDLIYVKDVDGRLVMANPAMVRLFGKPIAEIVGRTDIDLLEDPVQAKRIREIDHRVMQGRATEYVEEELTVGGNLRSFLSTKVPYANEDGEVIGLIGISRDITDRKNAEKELVHSRDRLASDVRERTLQLANLSRHLIRVSEEEKNKLARELHDELGSALAAISMDLGWILKQMRTIDPELAQRQERALDGIRATLDMKRRLVEGLRPLSLEHFGFDFALRAHCEGFAESSGIAVAVEGPEDPPRLDSGKGLALFRVVQECLTNVAKHARATRVVVSVEIAGGRVVVRVEDDGIGMPADLGDRPETYGLVGMRERLAEFAGTLSIGRGADGKGTRVEASVPLDAA